MLSDSSCAEAGASTDASAPRPDPFASLNAQQRAAVEHGLPGDARQAPPLLVIAGAGSGKTLTLASRVTRLVLAGADPQRILLLSFSRRAAHEMVQRAGRVLHQALGLPATQRPPAFPWAGTFHGIGARLLRDHAHRIGLADDFSIHDRSDSEDLMDLLRHELGFAKSEARMPLKGTCLAIYSRVVNSQRPLGEVLQHSYPWFGTCEHALKPLFRAYVQAKQDQHILDYDDLLLYWAQAVADPALAQDLGERFDHVLVDEYQDTNRLQAQVLLGMKPDGRGLTVVGDDAQSIYAFRAAEVRNILDFPQAFGVPATVVTLERNYRSTRPILDASNAVMELAAERFTKNLWTDQASDQRPLLVTVLDEADQARWVAEQVLQLREAGATLKSQAVLFRASHHSAALELELMRRNIPFMKFGGLKFLEASHIRDVLALLRWADNPRNRLAALRVAKLVPGIGAATARRLIDALAESTDAVATLRSCRVPGGARSAWAAFVDVYARLRQGEWTWPAELTVAIDWYLPQLQRLHDDAPVRQADLAQLARIAARFGSRERFLTELALDPPDATSDESGAPHLDEDYLILSTMHSAKGQEWRAVYVLNAIDGCIPSDLATGDAAQIEEERRLLYVAMTRAKEQLQLMVPQRFYVHQQTAFGERHVTGSLTRFIPASLTRFFETCCSQPLAQASARSERAGPAIDLRERVRAMWQ
jgi:DNA helicase-2/ATP-dependent DNA helicase PcrA